MGHDPNYRPCEHFLDQWREQYEEWEQEHKEASEAKQTFILAAAGAVTTCAVVVRVALLPACAVALAIAIEQYNDALDAVQEANDAASMLDTYAYNYYECMSDHKGAYEDADVPGEAEEIEEPDEGEIPDEPDGDEGDGEDGGDGED